MPEFRCRVATPTGEIIERTIVADSESALRQEIEADEMLLLDARRSGGVLGQAALFKPKISPREFMFFNQEMVALLKAGLPIINALDILIERRKNERFKAALVDIRSRVKSGESLSEAFSAQGELFPPLYAASLASGERSGELPTVLTRFVEYTRTVLEVRRKVVAALIYPAILLGLSVVLIGILVFFVIPRFEEFLTGLNVELPMITKLVLAVATFATGHWIELSLGVVSALLALFFWSKTGAGQLALDMLRMRVPFVGRVAQDYAQNRFTRTLATLQAGGIPLVTSLDLAARAVGNKLFERELLEVTRKVREGQALWESIEQTDLFSDITVEMVKVGESTGQLDAMLSSASEFTDEEIDYRLAKIVSLIEPAMLVFMAIIVCVMLMSMYLPMIQAYGNARGF